MPRQPESKAPTWRDEGGKRPARIEAYCDDTSKRLPWELEATTIGATLKLVDPATINPVMVLHRFHWDEPRAQSAALNWCENHFGATNEANRELQRDVLDRRAAVVAQLNRHSHGTKTRRVRLKVTGSISRVLIGIGSDVTPSGAALPIEPTSGLPFIPGSALRGLIRRSVPEDLIERLLGSTESAGRVDILDALPSDGLRVVHDAITPHYTSYLRTEGGEPPTGVESPNPLSLLAIEAGIFDTALVPQRDATDDDVQTVLDALRTGLHELGIGAKTAAGYGYITILETST